jgi:DHA2 family multidrug resistance protein
MSTNIGQAGISAPRPQNGADSDLPVPSPQATRHGQAIGPDDISHNKWAVSIAVMFGVLMSAIDTSVVNVAMPQIQGNVGATQQEITWISTAYMISVVILMPLTNFLSVRFGRKRIYLLSLTVFTASSFMCGLSRSLEELIFWRAVQGFGAGTLQPLAQAMFREAFPPKEQGVAMGLFGLVVLAGPAIGPTLGGYITDNYNWPWIFFINIPIGIIGFFVAMRVMVDPPYMKGTTHAHADGIGILLLAVGLAAMQTILEQGQTDDWYSSRFICWATAVSACTLIVFIWWELTHDDPAVDLRILKDVQFTAGTIIGGVLGVGLFASLFLLPQFMQVLIGFTATQSGLAMMPRSLAMMVGMPIAGALYNRLGPRILIVCGLIIGAYTQWVMSRFTIDIGLHDLLMPLIVQGFGFSMVFVSLSTAALSNIPRKKLTSATGLNNLIRQLGGSIGIAVVVTLLTQHIDRARAELVTNAQATNPLYMQQLHAMAGALVARGDSPSTALQAATGAVYMLVSRQAANIAYDYIFLWIGILFAICLPLVVFLKGLHEPANSVDRPAAE